MLKMSNETPEVPIYEKIMSILPFKQKTHK
jgi:hypothetical protein